MTLTLWRLYGSDSRVAVHYKTLPDTASPGLDYQSVTAGIAVFEPLQTLANITLQVHETYVHKKYELNVFYYR